MVRERRSRTPPTERASLDFLTGHDLDLISELYADDCAFYGMGTTEGVDRESTKCSSKLASKAFPDLSSSIDEMLVGDDRAAVRWHSSGAARAS